MAPGGTFQWAKGHTDKGTHHGCMLVLAWTSVIALARWHLGPGSQHPLLWWVVASSLALTCTRVW
jgi:hypothetical protein